LLLAYLLTYLPYLLYLLSTDHRATDQVNYFRKKKQKKNVLQQSQTMSSPPLRGTAEWSATREVALLLGLTGGNRHAAQQASSCGSARSASRLRPTDPQRCPSQRPRLPRRPHWRSSPQRHRRTPLRCLRQAQCLPLPHTCLPHLPTFPHRLYTPPHTSTAPRHRAYPTRRRHQRIRPAPALPDRPRSKGNPGSPHRGRRATLGPRATGLGPRPMKRQLRIPAHKWLIGGSPRF
jgi:hypothetical protein